MAVCSENNYCTKEMFVPCLTIYPSEWKRRIYLDNFLECMFDPNVLEEYNEKKKHNMQEYILLIFLNKSILKFLITLI